MSPHSEALEGLLSRPPMPSIIAAADEHAGAVLCVGGAVRDALLGRSGGDIDIVVGGELPAFIESFAGHCGRRPVAIGDPWRDIHRTFVEGAQVDVGRMLGDESEDLAQRDFSVNAMAVNLSEATRAAPVLIDDHGGANDLERRTIRMLSVDVLLEDPLRLLRAVRYVGTLEGFDIDPDTKVAIATHAGAIRNVAAERVQTEWAHLLESPAWAEAVELAEALGLDVLTLGAPVSLSDVKAWSRFERAEGIDVPSPDGIDEPSPGDEVVLRLAALLFGDRAESPAEVQRRLGERRWPTDLARRAARVGYWARRLSEVGPAELVDWALQDEVDAGRAALLARALHRRDVPADGEASVAALEAFARRAAEPRWVRGADLRELGMAPGPELGALLERVARGQIERRWDSAVAARNWASNRLGGGGQADD